MNRGTRVGQAYVALAVDGSGINEEIVDSFNEAGPGVEKSGEEHGERYSEGFDRGSRSRLGSIFDKVSDAARKRFGTAGDDAGEEMGRSLSQRVLDKTKDLGDKAAKELGDRLASKSKSVQSGIERAFSDDLADKIGQRFALQMVGAINATMDRGSGRSANPLADLFDRWINEAVSGNGSSGGGRGSRSVEKSLSDRVASILGAGNRNNLINAVGRGAGGLTSGMESILSLIGKIGSGANAMFKTFQTGFINSGGAVNALTGTMGGLSSVGSKVFSGFISSAPVVLASAGAIGLSLVVLTSVANALLAIVAALASTIASALVGALAVGSAGVVALGAAAGLTTLAFMSMDNTQKSMLVSAMKPLHEEAIGLGQTMLTQMVPAFSEWSRNLQVALAYAQPLASVMGGALARAGDILTASLSGPGVQMLLATLTTTLPGIVANLSSAVGGFVNGFSAMFSALLPFVLQFSQYLDRVAATFANWAESASGQNAIVDFVSRALDSLHSLWNFIGAVGNLLATVFFSDSGQSAGNNLFDRMADAANRFSTYISQDDRLDKWFAQGLAFAIALGDTIKGVGDILQSLNNAGIIGALSAIAKGFEDIAGAAKDAHDWIYNMASKIDDAIPLLGKLDALTGLRSTGGSSSSSTPTYQGGLGAGALIMNAQAQAKAANQSMPTASSISKSMDAILKSLQSSGSSALSNTYKSAGGYLPDPTKAAKQWQNPYIAYANSLIKKAPSLAATIKNAKRDADKMVLNAITSQQSSSAKAILSAAQSKDPDSVATALQSLVESQSASYANTISTLKTNAKNTVASAKDALSSAAQSLLSATSQKAADKALKQVKKAKAGVKQAKADKKAADATAAAMNAALANANAILTQQGTQTNAAAIAAIGTSASTSALAALGRVNNQTIADFAASRAEAATLLQDATQKLNDAIALRDNYQQQVSDSIKAFGALTTAQAQTINGVEQALTANDITSNLQDKLTQIQTFQNNLRTLLAEGLSNDAYKQLVDAGVDQGGAYAAALVQGGVGSVQQVNSLTDQISSVANDLGTQASDRLYQAGVDAAQGLVDGLTSLSSQLDSAATALGNSIANAVKAALGIASPSKVLIGLMDYVGDGAVIGLDNQKTKVSAAAGRFANNIAVSPEAAAYASRQGTGSSVSGNQKVGDVSLTVVTPTEDPKAVANEAINELVGRL